MPTFLSIVLATFLITLCVWVAVLFMFFKKDFLGKIVKFLVAFSAGTLMGGAFLHLMPEAAEEINANWLFGIFLISFAGFFYWKNCFFGAIAIKRIAKSIHSVI